MFGLGIWEILVIGVAALIFIGPDKLPGAARKTARMVGDLRRTADSFRAELMSDRIIEVEPNDESVPRGADADVSQEQENIDDIS